MDMHQYNLISPCRVANFDSTANVHSKVAISMYDALNDAGIALFLVVGINDMDWCSSLPSWKAGADKCSLQSGPSSGLKSQSAYPVLWWCLCERAAGLWTDEQEQVLSVVAQTAIIQAILPSAPACQTGHVLVMLLCDGCNIFKVVDIWNRRKYDGTIVQQQAVFLVKGKVALWLVYRRVRLHKKSAFGTLSARCTERTAWLLVSALPVEANSSTAESPWTLKAEKMALSPNDSGVQRGAQNSPAALACYLPRTYSMLNEYIES